MQVVVHIPEVYENEKELKLIFNPKNKSITYVSMNDRCYEEFECTVLPKGHGDLKDMEDIYEVIEGWEDVTSWIVDAIDCRTPTIIEADKEGDE